MHAVQFLGDTGKEIVLHAKSQTIHILAENKSKNPTEEKQKGQVIIYIRVSRQNLHTSLPKITNIKFKINHKIMLLL